MRIGINLSKADSEAIYERVKYEKSLEKAKAKFLEFAGIKHNFGAMDYAAIDRFYKLYNFNVEKACRKTCKEYLLDKILENFREMYDENVPENTIWKQAILKALTKE